MPQNLTRLAIYSVALVNKVPMVDIAKILLSHNLPLLLFLKESTSVSKGSLLSWD